MKLNSKRITTFMITLLFSLSAFAQNNNNAFRISISGNGASDQTILRMVNGASSSFDSSFDAWKLFSPNPNVPSIYTQINPGQELSINSLPEFTIDKSITIFTNIPVAGTYTISIEELYELSANYKISLTDISSNTHYRILGDTAFSFTFSPQQETPSFTFNISTPLDFTTVDESCIAMEDGSVLINNPGNTDWDIEILDANQTVMINNNSNSCSKNIGNLLPGNYSAQVESKGIIDQFNFNISPGVNLTSDFSFTSDTIYISEGGVIDVVNNSQNALSYDWDFDNGVYSIDHEPTYAFTTEGTYNVSLSTINSNCAVTSSKSLTVLQSNNLATSIAEANNKSILISNLGNGNYEINELTNSEKQIMVYNINGRLIQNQTSLSTSHRLSLQNHSSGIYIVKIITENESILNAKILR